MILLFLIVIKIIQDMLRDELDEDEYTETKQETLDQLKEFQESLERTLAGDLTLENQLTSMKLVSA